MADRFDVLMVVLMLCMMVEVTGRVFFDYNFASTDTVLLVCGIMYGNGVSGISESMQRGERRLTAWFFNTCLFMTTVRSFQEYGVTFWTMNITVFTVGFLWYDAIAPFRGMDVGRPTETTEQVGDDPTLAEWIRSTDLQNTRPQIVSGSDGVLELGRRQKMMTRLPNDKKMKMRMQITIRSIEIDEQVREQGRFTDILRALFEQINVIQLEAINNPWLGTKLEASPYWCRLHDPPHNPEKPWHGACYFRALPRPGQPMF